MASEQTVDPPRQELSAAKRALIEARLRGQVRSSGIVPRADRDGAPLSFAQERLWFIDRLEPGSATYNIHVAWRLGGALDQAALERALGEIVRRHEALRTVFREVDGAPVQVIAPFGGFALPVEDLSGLGEAERGVEARRRATEEAMRPFDLAAGPLFRAALLRLGEESHVLLLSMHHIVSDGWSMGVFSREFSALYAAYREGRGSPLPELEVQYGDYATWQRERLRGTMLERQLSYWRERLAGAPALVELPTDHPRPAVQTFRGGGARMELPGEPLERLRAFGRSEEATLYMVVLAAFQVLLSKYSGSEDVVVGSPIAGRTRDEVAGLIGCFVNTLVLRTDLSGDPSFREVLRQVREVTLGAYEHQELPFEKLVAELQPERSLSHSPLFQVSFSLDDVEESAGGGAELSTEAVEAEFSVAKFDLTLALVATRRMLWGGLTYSTDLFEHGTVERMIGHLTRVLEQVAADPDVRLSRLELLGEPERALVVDAWNRTAAAYPGESCIHALFEAQAARAPDALAIEFEGETLRYGALNARANRLAHRLAGLGVGPETRVGICLERGPEMVVAVLAVLKAGGAFVPLDPAYPAERLAFVLADAAVPVLVTQESLRATLPVADGIAVVSVDGDAARIAAESPENPARGVSPDHLAYVIHTSGSTGTPKGVMVPHRGVPNLAYAQAYRFGIDATSRVLQFASFSFDAAVAEVFDTLLTGATLVMASRDALLPGAGLLETLRGGRVTVATLPPSVLAILSPDDLPELRTVVSAGEAVDAATVERWSAGRTFVNAYGPTETTVCATAARCEADGRNPAIGRALENVRVYVLDAAGRPAPLGVPGELYVGGVGVARGYLGRPGLTAEKFIPDAFGETGARLYRTGDRVRWRAEGMLEYLGRVDAQVKVRGFRIEPGEIEAVLSAHAQVREARVIVWEDVPGDKRLVAYVVGGVEADALREHVRRSLPEHMVPAAYVVLDALPLTPNGKLDRKALPAPEGDSYARRSYEAPLGEVEVALAGVWAEVLGLDRVGRRDHFFELGGHSLLAIRLIERMRRAGLHTDVRALFTTPILAELALAVGSASTEMEIPANAIPEGSESITPRMLPLVELTQVEIDRIVAEVPGGAANVQDIYPLAPLQEGFLFHHLMSQEGDPYLTPSVTEFDTRARLDQYLAALQAVIDRHDILRTAVAWEGLREPVQVVWRHAPLPVDEVEVDPDAAAGAVEQLWRRYDPRHYRMDLTRAPLRRACIAEDRARGRWLLLTLMHHLIGDHESLELQQEEVAAHLLGRQSELPAPLPFRNYVAQARLGVSQEEHERFFTGMLGDIEEPTAPYGLLDVWGEGHGIGEAWLPVANELSARLRRRARALGVSAASLCHLAWAQVLARLSGREDVVFGTLLFGRMQGGEGTERVMGPFINTLPVRIGVGEETAEAAVRRTHALLADLLRHEHASLALAQRCSGVAAPAPLFTSLLNYRYSGATNRAQDAGQVEDAGKAEEGVRGIGVQERTNYPVMLSVDDWGEAFSLAAQVAAPADPRRVCRMMHTALERLVEALEVAPGRAIGSLDVLPEGERLQVVDEWNRTDAEYPTGACIHALIEAQAARTPDAVAVVFEAESVTYAELDARANRLAHHLAGLGAGPEARVGICVHRSAEMVVAMLAVLKTGAAYLPLDPSYPADRLAYMLADSGAPLLVTQGSLRGLLPTDGVRIVLVDEDAASIASNSADAPRTPVDAANAAYVIYTSGSTGTPKGVQVTHGNAVSFFAGMDERVGGSAAGTWLAVTRISFDIHVLELLWTLARGFRVVVQPEPDRARDGESVAEQIRRHAVTHLQCTPSLAAMVIAESGVEALSGLERILLGGEALPPDLAAQITAVLPDGLVNMYGPTETTVWSATHAVDAAAGTIPIGRPIANTRVYVLDAALRPQPAGVPGELFIGGRGVTRGYLGRPGLTAERFVPDAFSADPGARLYRTGDRARWTMEGVLEYLGRLDAQVKVRGFRIEPGEVEVVLRRHPAVAECAVVARTAPAGDVRLVAYVVGSADAEALREHLRDSLPDYMVPSAFVPLDALPLTPNGKLDRKALPAPELASAEAGYVAPRTPTEEVLAGIWVEVLRVERVGVEDRFFDLGGHSLLATRVLARVHQVFGVDLPLRAVFERPVLSGLAAEIDRLRGTGMAAGESAIAPAPREGDLPVTFAQERLWFVDALDPGSPVYAMPFSYRITGDLDEDALRRALAELVRRHEPLRTTLPAVDGVPVQRIAPAPAVFDLPVADLRHLPEQERRPRAGRLAAEDARYRFDLARGPLFRASLVHVADAEHLLLLNLHHSIGDGWSLGVLREELSALYGAFSRGEASPLPEPALQYADYAVWQRERLSGAALERQVEFWRQALDGAPALLELPTDRPRPPVESHRGAVEQMMVSPGLTAEVNALARREGATLFMVLLSALDVVLGRLAGQEDVVVGTPIAGRTRAETERMVGVFLNSLALRTDLSGDPSFRELLGRVRESTLDAYAHQDLPFERVLEEVRPERSLAHAPVFQVMLNLANFQEGDFRAEGLEVAGGGAAGEVSSKFDLTLYVGEWDGRIVVTLVYAAELFDAPRMRGLLAQLEGVLRQAAAAPETRVGALSLATEAALGVLPDPARPIEAEAWRGAVHETFAAHAAQSPDALAISAAGEAWTYAELDAAANRIAHRLIDGGVRPGDVVAVYAHRSPALIRALLGAWKAGAAFAVLDPAYPPARLAAQAGAARPTALLKISAAGEVPAEVAAALAESARLTVVLTADGKDDGLGGFSSAAPAVSVAADDLAYVAFTSGTTGTPKAIAGTHRPLAHFFGWYARELGIGAADRVSLLSGLAHDPLLRDVFAPLAVCGSIAIPDAGEIGTPGWLAGWMRDSGVTVAHLTPAMGQVMATGAGDTLPALRLACFGGDVLRAADVERLRALAPNAEAVNFYGATETPQAMGFFRLPADLASVGPRVPVGRGIDGVDLLVITPTGTLAGIGELGEISVRTPYLARGYLNDAELTAARFVPNPLTGDPADRVYRTGDLGRYRPDGAVEPSGRVDGQVKVRGFRVELGEIEAALAKHPSVREAVVAARGEDPDRVLVAYAVPREGAGIEAEALRTHLKSILPDYMVPAAFVAIAAVPLTANGKVDRRALPEPESVGTDSHSAAPRTPTEEILAQIWAEVLRKESVGVDDDFFVLGGHSLLATRVLARVQNALGVVLPLRALFEGPTVAELAVRVEEMRRAGLPVLPPVVPVDRDRPLPLSFAQERLWFLDRLEGGSASYNIPAALRLGGALDVDALEWSLGEILRRHESLRTVFREVEGGAVQVIAPFAGFALPVDDLSGLHETDRATEVRRRAREDASRPFDLAEGPLFRAALLRVADEEHVLLLCIHHIVSDGWSTGVLHRELGALYAAFSRGEPDPLPPLPVQYADFAVWQREQLQGEVLDRQVGYWKERMAGAPALLELPTDRPRPAVQTYRGTRERFDLPRALLDGLQALGRSEGATLYMVMLSAFQLLLSKYSGSEDVVVGSPIAGRTRREVEELIGFFVNTLVLRTDLSADPTFRELLGRVREGTLGAYEHQEVPFERLVAELQPERSLSHAPLFQVMFILQNADRSGGGLAGLRMEGAAAEVETTRFDLSLTAVPHDGGVHCILEYSTDLFDRSTVRRMLGHLQRVLEQAAADADVRLSRLELLAEDERGLVVDAWNRTAAEYPADRCIHELFEAQVAGTPDATAVRFAGETLSYAALDHAANRLANHLRRRGVRPETRVGICLERGTELVVSILAVLKAGGAWVPLDPAYPAERLAFMLADSGAPLLLTRLPLPERLAPQAVEVVCLDADRARIEAESTLAPAAGVLPGNLAYVIYTSGSTGRPKGVLVPHRGLANVARGHARELGVQAGDRVLQFASPSFDASVFEMVMALAAGATLVLGTRETLAPGPDLLRLLTDEAVTVATLPPSALAVLPAGELPALRTLMTAGEACTAELVDRWAPQRRFFNLYGPTEATIWSATAACTPGGGRPPIGRPVANTTAYVLDARGAPVPVGVPGELYVGGAGVARGYAGRPGLTAERFVPDPFGGEHGARLYRTGDRVRWLARGELEFLGRVDAQVKVRGFRIEPGEIEARLAEHAGVREAVVLVREDTPGDRRLVAYVAGDESAAADVLRAHLSERLPLYMVPAAYVRLDALPLTPNGKVDRKALPAPEGAAFAAREYEAPEGNVEGTVAAIWADLLGVERVGRRDDFFHLGGNSLLATRLVFRIKREMDVELSVRDIFEKPELSLLAQHVLDEQLAQFDPGQIEELLALVRAADVG